MDLNAEPPVPAGVGSLREEEPLAPIARMGYGEPAKGGAVPGTFAAASTQSPSKRAMSDIPFSVELDEPERGADPKKPAGKPPGKPPKKDEGESPPVWTVSQLTRRIRLLLEEALPTVSVEGEISNLKQAASGHLYFNLKDEDAQIRCVMFRTAAQSLRFTPEDGLQAILRGKLTVYEVRGEYQLQVLALEPKGIGALQLAFEQLKKKLEAEGLFDPARKKALPFLPRRVGIVTSPRGAAIQDILTVLERRFPGMPALIYPATVQGEKAAGEIAEGIAALNRLAEAQKIDVIIVGRGGGSVEDLWAFNEEIVARAIFASAVPIVSAVGHEVDFTIADFVADLRAPTPSAAAELVVPPRAELVATVVDLRERLLGRLADDLELGRERWSGLRARLASPDAAIRNLAQRTDDLRERIELAARGWLRQTAERLRQGRSGLEALRPDRFNRLHRASLRSLERRLRPGLRRHLTLLRERVSAQLGLLDSLSPLTVMRRGYGAIRDQAGRLVRSVAQVKVGDALSLRLHDGTVEAEATGVTEEGEPNR